MAHVVCPGCGRRLDRVARDVNGKQICPNEKCGIAIVGNGVIKED